MLNNRILVIGLELRYLEFISQMKSDFIFIHLDHPSKYRPAIHSIEGLIFDSQQLLNMGDILNEFKLKPVIGMGKGPTIEGIRWVSTPTKPEILESILLEALGTLRSPPQNTGKLETGTIVKNKTFSSWGLGVVKKALDDDLFLVSFPQAMKTLKKEDHVCHKSALRIICSIKELTNETSK